ncbi:hypothetical protein BH23ACT4_BH23ACT4_01250 [soil metagenome]
MYVLWATISLAVVLVLALLNPGYFRYDIGDADVMNDRVVASAFLTGVNPYSDLDELAERFSSGRYNPPEVDPEFEGANRTPRTPGAIAISSLLVLIPLDRLVQANNLLGAILLVPVIFLIIRGQHHPRWLLLSLAVFFSAAMIWSIRFSTITPLVALVSTFAIVGIRAGDKSSNGIAIAIAGTMKAFPLILLVLAAAHRRWRTFGWGVGSLTIINLLPILTPHVTFPEAMDALLGASARYGYTTVNTSLTRLISDVSDPIIGFATFALVIVFISWWIIVSPSNVATDAVILLGVAILLAPLSWPHYALTFYPAALLFVSSPTTHFGPRTVAVASLFLAFPTGEPWAGAAGILILTIVAVYQRVKLSPLRQPLSVPFSAR